MIKEPYTIEEIRQKIASHDYSAELLLQHAMLHLELLTKQEPVPQWRKPHCFDWHDGHPDNSDGGGPYEIRTLYAAPVPAKQEPVLHQHKKPIVDDSGEITGFTDWQDGNGLPWWPKRSLYAAPVSATQQPLTGDPSRDYLSEIELLRVKIKRLEAERDDLLGHLRDLCSYCRETGNTWLCFYEAEAAIVKMEGQS